MSPSTPANESAVSTGERSSLRRHLRAGAFWAAVLLPFCTLGLLASGLDTNADYALFAGFIAGNVLALFVGHDYGT
ncbi:hypothetical protein [Natronomonas amylolytica]|uniref:hypothetical protein n=1 Tax=Natronomonas amylolytica TaxID=3108498 RepID=UPI00300A7171